MFNNSQNSIFLTDLGETETCNLLRYKNLIKPGTINVIRTSYKNWGK